MTNPTMQTTILSALAAFLLGVSATANVQLMAWAMWSLPEQPTHLGSVLWFHIAAGIVVAVDVGVAMFLSEFAKWSRLFKSLAAYPPEALRPVVILIAVLLIGRAIAQAVAVFAVRVVEDSTLASGAEPLAPVNLPFGVSYAAGDPTLLAIAFVLPIFVAGSVVVLMHQLSGIVGPAARASSGSEGSVTRN